MGSELYIIYISKIIIDKHRRRLWNTLQGWWYYNITLYRKHTRVGNYNVIYVCNYYSIILFLFFTPPPPPADHSRRFDRYK